MKRLAAVLLVLVAAGCGSKDITPKATGIPSTTTSSSTLPPITTSTSTAAPSSTTTTTGG
jgi:hypothetical protein